MIKNKQPVENHFQRLSCYHYVSFTIMFLAKIPIYWHLMSLIFISPPMDFYCDGTFRGKCPCPDPWWDRRVFTKTMQTKFDLLCERRWLISFSQSMLYVGTFIGALLFGYLSDKYGRLLIFSICCLCLGITGCLVSIMSTIGPFIFARCLEGIAIGGAVITGYVLLVEFCGIRQRETVTALYHLPLNIGHVTMAVISYYIRDCDTFQLVLSMPMFFCAMSWFLIYESPKWLLDNGQVERAVLTMQNIAKFNRSSSCDNIQAEMEEYHVTQSHAHAKLNFWQIFRYKRLRLNLLCMSFIYLVCGMGYYGVSQYIGYMSGNIHKNVIFSGLLLIPGTLLTVMLLKLLNRRIFLMGTHVLSGFCMIAVVCIPANYIHTRMAIAALGNTFFFMSFIIVFLYGVELFPTSIRTSTLGFLSVLSRIGQIIAPPINAMDPTIAGAIFGIAAMIGAVLCYPLPETKNLGLPSSLEDSEALSQKPEKPSTSE